MKRLLMLLFLTLFLRAPIAIIAQDEPQRIAKGPGDDELYSFDSDPDLDSDESAGYVTADDDDGDSRSAGDVDGPEEAFAPPPPITGLLLAENNNALPGSGRVETDDEDWQDPDDEPAAEEDEEYSDSSDEPKKEAEPVSAPQMGTVETTVSAPIEVAASLPVEQEPQEEEYVDAPDEPKKVKKTEKQLQYEGLVKQEKELVETLKAGSENKTDIEKKDLNWQLKASKDRADRYSALAKVHVDHDTFLKNIGIAPKERLWWQLWAKWNDRSLKLAAKKSFEQMQNILDEKINSSPYSNEKDAALVASVKKSLLDHDKLARNNAGLSPKSSKNDQIDDYEKGLYGTLATINESKASDLIKVLPRNISTMHKDIVQRAQHQESMPPVEEVG
jgi:hypothetical protein